MTSFNPLTTILSKKNHWMEVITTYGKPIFTLSLILRESNLLQLLNPRSLLIMLRRKLRKKKCILATNEYDSSLLYSCQHCRTSTESVYQTCIYCYILDNDRECVSDMVQTLDGIFAKMQWYY